MTHSLIGADRATHLKIVAVALAGAITVILVGITARVTDIGAAGAQNVVVKAGKAMTLTTNDASAIR